MNTFGQVNMQYVGDTSSVSWRVAGVLKSGILWRGVASDSTNYHSLVFVRSSSSTSSSLVAACSSPANCPYELSMVSFTGAMTLSSDRSAIPCSSQIRDLGVLMGIAGGGGPSLYSAKTVVAGQQLYMLSSDDRQWGMWTHCAPCPANSFSPAGSGAYSTPGVGVCKCQSNFYGVIQRPVVDSCSVCRIQYNISDPALQQLDANASCNVGQYKTNIPCRWSANADRSVDPTCAGCRQSCRPGDASTKFPGEYISRTCDGTGFEPSVGCSLCSTQCASDDQYMRDDVVCSGTTTVDTRPLQGCMPCTARCPAGAYVSN